MKRNPEFRINVSRYAVAGLVALVLLLAFTSCGKDEEKIGEVDIPISFEANAEVPAGAVEIATEDELRLFVSGSGEGAHGFISQPLELTENLVVDRPGIRLESAPGAVVTIALPEDESYQWPVINTLDAITVEADDVTMAGLTIIAPDEGYNAYNVVSVGNADGFRFENGSITGEAARNEDGNVTDYTVSTGISVSSRAKDAVVANSIIKDALTPVRIASGSTDLSNLIFNSDISVGYEYGADDDMEITGCTALPSGEVADGGRIVFAKSQYGRSISETLLTQYREANSSIGFIAK